jgi:hypothetical protein
MSASGETRALSPELRALIVQQLAAALADAWRRKAACLERELEGVAER